VVGFDHHASGDTRAATLLELAARPPPVFEIPGGPMTTGTVKKLVSERGFGFITGEDGKDYFFHRSSLVPSLDFDRLAGGEKVQFEIERDPKGARASNVELA
jgi:CspA family cold shock protein